MSYHLIGVATRDAPATPPTSAARLLAMLRRWLTLTGCLIVASLRAEGIDFPLAQKFVQQHCVRCHNDTKTQGDLNLAHFTKPDELLAERGRWEQIAQRVKAREMPPAKSPQPAASESAAFATWVETTQRQLAQANGPVNHWPNPVRRLNKSQYRATVRDLLGIPFDAAKGLPDDGAGGQGFDNAAETLFLSPVHAEKYFDAAAEALDYARRDSNARKLILVARPDDKRTPEQAARMVIAKFLPRAYRRPVEASEVDRLVALFRKTHRDGDNFDESMLYTLRAALLSPQFLFRVEKPAKGATPEPLSDHELATRLSYFLWNTLPDDVLTDLANAGKLRQPEVLKKQVARMLKDRRAFDFCESFVGQWLETRELGVSRRADAKLFPGINDEQLVYAIKLEPIKLFQTILSDNRPLLELIDCDYTFANSSLVKHYGLKAEKGINQNSVRVPLPADSHRGGVLTMASVLAVSSYPHRTSPVLRGKWVLEVLLGTPPPPPPKDVPPLSDKKDDIAGKTLRERLAIHRADATCASCHDRIDPVGFALENYDFVGRWRKDDAGKRIDASGILPGGQSIDGPDDLKKALLARKDEFAKHLTAKLLGYALGRGLVDSDYVVVDRIAADLPKAGYNSQALIERIVLSRPFTQKPGKVGK